MHTVNIHEAKTQLSRLIEQAVKGEPFIIAKAGKPLVKVTRLDAPSAGQLRRLGFMAGQISVPDDFDRMGTGQLDYQNAIKRDLPIGSGENRKRTPLHRPTAHETPRRLVACAQCRAYAGATAQFRKPTVGQLLAANFKKSAGSTYHISLNRTHQ